MKKFALLGAAAVLATPVMAQEATQEPGMIGFNVSEFAAFDRRIWRTHAVQHWPLSAHAVLPARVLWPRGRGWRRRRNGRGDCSRTVRFG